MKLALARAMVDDPPNIVLDEPANGLDVRAARPLRTLLKSFETRASVCSSLRI
jgi:sodium transport system ATP-binding protein